MTTCLGNSFSFGELCVSFVHVCQMLCVSFPFYIEGRMWDVIVFILVRLPNEDFECNPKK